MKVLGAFEADFVMVVEDVALETSPKKANNRFRSSLVKVLGAFEADFVLVVEDVTLSQY